MSVKRTNLTVDIYIFITATTKYNITILTTILHIYLYMYI